MKPVKKLAPNPKDLLGLQKISITKLPAVAIVHGAHAFMDGAVKYGPYNWRTKPVKASIYCDALIRHVLDWFERQEVAKDSGVHHLGHVIADAGILLDALHIGNLIDDRPFVTESDAFDNLLEQLKKSIVARQEARAAAAKKASRKRVKHGRK